MIFRHAHLLTLALTTTPALGAFDEAPPLDLLRGPEVQSVAHDSNLGMLSNGPQRRALRRDSVPVRRWFVEFAELNLTGEQRELFKQLRYDFNAGATAFKSAHGERLTQVRKELRAFGETDRPAPAERVRALQDEQARLERDAPRVQTLQVSCWGMLTMAQQDAFRVRLAEIRAELRKERAVERMREQATMQEGAMQDAPMNSDSAQDEDAQGKRRSGSDGYD